MFTLHFIIVLHSKKNPKEYRVEAHTLTGENVVERMKAIIETECRSWHDEFELVNVSHAFLPFEVGNQL